jgi:hypothetical protein
MDRKTIDDLISIDLVARCDMGDRWKRSSGCFCLIPGQGGIFFRGTPPCRDRRRNPKMLNALNFQSGVKNETTWTGFSGVTVSCDN